MELCLLPHLSRVLTSKNALAVKPILDVLPFSFERKRMTTVHKLNGNVLIYTKGAPRNILDVCSKVLIDGKIVDLDQDKMMWIETRIHKFANAGLRVIAAAYKEIPKTEYNKSVEVENNLIFVGLAGMRDPPRSELKHAVEKARRVLKLLLSLAIMVQPQSVAQEVGIVEREFGQVIRGVDLEDLSDQAIIDEVKKGNVIFARVSPEQKLRLSKVLKKSGEVVAVTGDGANDAPSLKEADIGVAMGALERMCS